MAGFALSGRSREGLLLAVFLVGAIAAVNGNTFIINSSNNYVGLFDTTAGTTLMEISPGSQYTANFRYSNDVTETHLTYFEYYDVAPNTTANAPVSSGNTFVFASAQVYDNATITFSTQTGWAKVGVIVKYST